MSADSNCNCTATTYRLAVANAAHRHWNSGHYVAVLVVGIEFLRYVGVPRTEQRRLRKLTFIPDFSAAFLLAGGGLLNPIGIRLVWQSALPGAAGAHNGLLWLRYYIPKKTVPERGSQGIGRNDVWIIVAAILSLFFIFGLARGITLDRY